MKIRSKEELIKKLDTSYSWRKKEMSFFCQLVPKSHPSIHGYYHARAAVLCFYAHWEGYVKDGSRYFLTYLTNKSLRIAKVSEEIKTAHILHILKNTSINLEQRAHLINQDLSTSSQCKFSLSPDIIDTKSNLSFEVLQDISCVIGVDPNALETKRIFINEVLLGNRNKIAHGERIDMNPDYLDEIYQNTKMCLNSFDNLIRNAIATDSFLSP
ncbi:HEPN-RiboL-PSP domain-containing protein [Sulfidibacter corallicola]|uniref:RiboL-PSP-HEPN domain-containing protein n=1 Tax=Sulfidibacter corallicola TaxID=2818388 RepID=A0A8A4TKL5_SULCO|nr:MAE_28990/MAE_18760 family HEPN-like nuclease [Sulfidibacter corallicola]QTD49744.1 hypothetical protein J3U87_29525 [Sulfidibacter corallicola]